MKKFFQEFKKFISRGNVFDMAVGLIIATAFNKIVSSLVNDIIMPLVTMATGANSLADLSIPLRIVDGEVTLAFAYGAFLQTIIDFLIIALSVFLMVKIMVNSQKKFKEVQGFLKAEAGEKARKVKKELRKKAKEEGKKFGVLWKEHKLEQKRIAEETKKAAEELKKQQEEAEKLAHPGEEALLMEIRDSLKALNQKLGADEQIKLPEVDKAKEDKKD